MQSHTHPTSGAQIAGLVLGAGAVLTNTDCYSSSSGEWALCPCPGLTLGPRAGAIWIRSGAELSPLGEELLGYLVSQKYLLVNTTHWKMIPSARWKHDRRMDWAVLHSEAAQELLTFGFVEPTSDDSEILQVSEVGFSYIRTMQQH